MIPTTMLKPSFAAALTLALAAPSAVLAYDKSDAIRDCESRIKSEYGLSDTRDTSAVQLQDSNKHYKVAGKTKVDGKKYPWTCEVKDRHVTSISYDGPKPEGMGTSEKLAIGAAAAIAAGVVASKMMEKDEPAEVSITGLNACKDAVKDETAYRGLPDSAFSVMAKEHGNANVEWQVETATMKDWGTCQVSAEGEVLAVRTMKHERKK
jgi:hypothetical protein